jgi:hypothetical protein
VQNNGREKFKTVIDMVTSIMEAKMKDESDTFKF